MKHFLTYIFAAIILLAGCQKSASNTSVRLSSAGSDFVNNEAELIVSLNNKIDTPVKVRLVMSGNIPADHIRFDKVLTIPSGENALGTSVAVLDAENLNAGRYTATFTIAAAEGANIDHKNNSVTINLNVEAKPQNIE